MKKRLISFDWAIKKILRNKANFGILEGFLSELITPDKNLKIIKLLESESNKETKDNKSNRVDILVEIEPGDIVIIEVQVDCELDFLHRVLFGTSKVITEHLAKKQPYAKIKKVYSVNILYFDLGHGKDYIYKGTTDFIGMHNKEVLQLNVRQKKIYQKELINEIYPEYYLIKINNFDGLAKNTLDEWIYFLKNEEIKPEFHAKGLQEAKVELDILKLSYEDREEYERYQDDLHYQASMIESSYVEGKYHGEKAGEKIGLKKGLEKGLKKGLEKGKKDIVLNMLKNNISLDNVAKFTGLSLEEIKQLTRK